MIKKGALTGLLLFGMFFGAGNLIFPPQLGLESGPHFWAAIAGFVLSGVGIAILTLVVGASNPKGYMDEISQKIAPWFAIAYLVVLYLSIGPFFAIPRTATTAFSVGIEPMLPADSHTISLFVFTTIYFVLAYIIALNPSKILDSIGRYLTPIFAILIVVLVVLGAFRYGVAAPQPATAEYAGSAFGAGFLQGYNTLDALASVAFSVVAVATLNQLGFKNRKEYVSTIWVVGILVAIGFSVLYVGLGFLGNHFPLDTAQLPQGANIGASVLSSATQAIFGPAAQIFLAVMVTVTCFTTTAGLIVSTGEFFHNTFPKLSYKVYATVFTLIGFAIANLGLNAIIQYSLPVLMILYPITITIVMIVIVNKILPLSKPGMQFTIAIVALIAAASVLVPQFKIKGLENMINSLPLAGASLPWLLPALAGIILSLFLPNKQKSERFELD